MIRKDDDDDRAYFNFIVSSNSMSPTKNNTRNGLLVGCDNGPTKARLNRPRPTNRIRKKQTTTSKTKKRACIKIMKTKSSDENLDETSFKK